MPSDSTRMGRQELLRGSGGLLVRTADEIKRAYRKLARDNHPDKHPGDKVAEERFKKVAEAYDVLGDDKKRKEYDELKDLIASGGIPGFGSGGFGGNSTGFGGGFRQAADFDVSDLFGGGRGGFSSDGSSFSDIFGGLFNRGGSGGGYPTQHGPTHEGSGRGSGVLRWTSGKPPRVQHCPYSSPARHLVPLVTALDPKPETRRPADTATAPGLPLKTKGHSGFLRPACTAAARGR